MCKETNEKIYISHSEQETEKIGEEFAAGLPKGTVVTIGSFALVKY